MTKTKKMKAGWILPVSSTAPASVAAPVAAPAAASVPSIPGMPPLPQPQSGGLDPFSMAITTLNTNPYIIGVFMLLLNLGGRFLSLELTKKQEAFLQAPWIRPFIFFTVVFMATRNVVVAFWLTVLLFFVIWVVANEHSPFCMIPDWCGTNSQNEKTNYLKNIQRLFSSK
jgi:hypothetical protein